MDNEQLEIGLVGAFLSWRKFAQMNFQCFTFLWIDFRQKQQQQWEGTGANFSWLKHSRHIFEILFAYFFQPGHISPGKIMLSRFSDFFQIFLQPGSCTALQVSDGEDVFIRILRIFFKYFQNQAGAPHCRFLPEKTFSSSTRSRLGSGRSWKQNKHW